MLALRKDRRNANRVVKIRLSRMGTKARPFYRMVVANSTEPRGGKFVEILGTYNPVAKPVHMSIREERALHWLMQGAQPTETAAVVLNKAGVLDRYFEARPTAKKSFKFLDKRTAAISVKSVIEAPAVEAAPAPAPAPAPEPEPEPVAEEAPAAEEPVDVVAESAAEEAPVNEPAAEEAPADEAPAAEEAPAEEDAAEEKSE